jgi:hypothetical protein
MLRRRSRRTAPSWIRHPAAGVLCLGVLYLTATVVMMLLALRMSEWWPTLIAIAMAVVTAFCGVRAWRHFR